MKLNRRIAALLVVVLLLTALLPLEGLAENYKVKNLQLNSWYRLGKPTTTMAVYKLKITEETVVTLSWANNTVDSYLSDVSVYYDRDCKNRVDYQLGISAEKASGSSFTVLYPGTYYVKMYDWNKKAKARITTKPATQVNRDNYSLRKAFTLKGGTKEAIAQTRKDNYPRWYRLKLTKKQVITLYNYSGFFDLYE